MDSQHSDTHFSSIVQTVTFALLLSTMIPIAASAQRGGGPQRGGGAGAPQGSVSGTVIDTAMSEPLPGATVAIRNVADSSLVTGDIADKAGQFAIAGIKPGHYYARVSFVGYVTRMVDLVVTPASPAVALGAISLTPDATLGREVSITAKREFMTQAIDRTIYRTSDIAVASGGTASDILRNIPSIEVDVNGRISLRGNQNVVIQINGRPTMLSGDALAGFLQSLSASTVERVEVIPNPSAKYDPDGMVGIINIVLKQQSDRGLSGGVNGSVGTNLFDTYGTAGGNIGYGSGDLNALLNYGFAYNNYRNEGTYYRENFLPTSTPLLDQASTSTWRSKAHTLNGNIDYTIDPSNTISFAGLASINYPESRGFTTYNDMNGNRELVRRHQRTNVGDGDYLSLDYNLSYTRIFEPRKHELSVEGRYARNFNIDDDTYEVTNLPLDGGAAGDPTQTQLVHSDFQTHQATAQADYTKEFEPGLRMEAGYKLEIERLESDQSSSASGEIDSAVMSNVQFNTSISYDRDIHSGYLNLRKDLGPVTVQAGVRLEQANTTFDLVNTTETYRNDYFSIFPSAFVLYRPTESSQLRLSYSKRIGRPSVWMLNPYVSQEDELFHRTGNPYLRPEYIHAMQLSAGLFSETASLTITPFYSHNTDVMRRIPAIDTNGITTVTFQNLATSDSWGAEMAGTIRVDDWFNGMLSGGVYRFVTEAGEVGNSFNSEALGWSLRGNATFTLMQGLDLQVVGAYHAPMKIEGGEMLGNTETELALTQKVFQDRGRLGLRVSDPFNTQRWSIVRNSDDYYIKLHQTWNSTNVMLSFNYVFGTPDPSRRMEEDGPRPPAPGLGG